jgi:aspartate aminotransferase
MISNRVTQLVESETLAMAKKARHLTSLGHDIISLSTGEPDFPTPDHIKKAAIDAIHQNKTYYTPVAGIPELRKAIVDKLLRENQLSYSPDQIIVSTGAKQSIMNLILSIINPGDEVIIPSPYWVSYIQMVKFAGGIPVIVPCRIEDQYKITPSQLKAHITSKTKLLLYSSPCNPTGSSFTMQELVALSEVLLPHPQMMICSDEIYEHIQYQGQHASIAQLEEMKERTLVVNGVSKSFSMTGWRIGYLAGPKEIVDACEKLQGQFTSGANSIAQHAAIAALSDYIEPTLEMNEAFRKRRDLAVSLANRIPGFTTFVPQGAFYLFPDISRLLGKKYERTVIQNDNDLAFYLLEHAHVATVQGSAFGMEHNLRLSFACSEKNLEIAFSRIQQALEKLEDA